MKYHLTKVGAEWCIEVSGDPVLEPFWKMFKSREAAEEWQRECIEDKKHVPVLLPFGAKPKSKVKRGKKK